MDIASKKKGEGTNLIQREKSDWTRKDRLLLLFFVLIEVGNGVEIYLPGVIMQQVSCDVRLSQWKEGLLDCIQYFTLALATLLSGIVGKRFKSRNLTLLSLYLSVLATVACAVVANFTTLLLSRALIGFCLGLNFSSHGVMTAELAGSKEIFDKIVFAGAVMLSIGGAWCGVLGFFLLDCLGWRVLILLTSLPLFIPAIFMIHFIFDEESDPSLGQENYDVQKFQDDNLNNMTSQNFLVRVLKLGLFSAITTFQGWGLIVLVPTMIQLLKIKEAGPNPDCHVTVTQGAELLLVALVTSAAIPGRLFVHFTRNKFSFRKVQLCVAVLNVVCFTIMLLQDSRAGIVVANLTVKLMYGASAMAARYLVYDKRYFGESKFALGCGVTHSLKLFGGVAGTALVAFSPVSAVLMTCLVLGVLQVLTVLSMKEVQQLSEL